MVEHYPFKLNSEFDPQGDHSRSGTGKTFTMSNVIKEVGKPTLIIAHNKTLAGQLYSEFKEFFLKIE